MLATDMQWLTIQAHKDKTRWERVKAHLKERAQALFPWVEVTLKTADALLILEAGRMLEACVGTATLPLGIWLPAQ
jgi:hypothetical protein